MFLILVLYALLATTFIIGREAVLIVPPILFIGIRMILAGIVLLGFVKATKKEPLKITKAELPWFIGIVLFHIYGSYVAEFVSLQYLTGSTVSLLYNLAPFITALFAYAFFRETLSTRKWFGLLIGFLAFIPVLVTDPAVGQSSAHNLYAEGILMLSIISSCAGWIFMKQLITKFKHSYVFVNGIGMFFGGLLALAHSHFTECWPDLIALSSNMVIVRGLVLLILVGNIICYNLYGKLLHSYSATALSFFGATTPLFAALFEWFWLGDVVTPWFYVTALLVGFGLYIFYQEELKSGVLTQASETVASQEEDAAR